MLDREDISTKERTTVDHSDITADRAGRPSIRYIAHAHKTTETLTSIAVNICDSLSILIYYCKL